MNIKVYPGLTPIPSLTVDIPQLSNPSKHPGYNIQQTRI